MGKDSKTKEEELSAKGLKKLRGELWIILPFLVFSLCMFLGGFRYPLGAGILPIFVGFFTLVIAGMRLYHIIFPRSRIGDFKEAGLGGEFDSMKEEIEEEVLRVRSEEVLNVHEEETVHEISSGAERKALIALIGCLGSFLLFGYLVGTFFVIVGTSYYYGYKQKGPLLITLVILYFIIYILLYKLLGAPADFGLVLEPILESLNLI